MASASVANGAVTSVTITSFVPGRYTSPPTVIFTGGGGRSASDPLRGENGSDSEIIFNSVPLYRAKGGSGGIGGGSNIFLTQGGSGGGNCGSDPNRLVSGIPINTYGGLLSTSNIVNGIQVSVIGNSNYVGGFCFGNIGGEGRGRVSDNLVHFQNYKGGGGGGAGGLAMYYNPVPSATAYQTVVAEGGVGLAVINNIDFKTFFNLPTDNSIGEYISAENKVYFAGGGGGAWMDNNSYRTTIGGKGGGGRSGTYYDSPGEGLPNSGGGAGGGTLGASAKGGSGVVIIKYRNIIEPISSLELIGGLPNDKYIDYSLGNYNGNFKIISSVLGTSNERMLLTSNGDFTFNENVNIYNKLSETKLTIKNDFNTITSSPPAPIQMITGNYKYMMFTYTTETISNTRQTL
jgi:hypothetical protein